LKEIKPKFVPEHITLTSGPHRYWVISFMPWQLYLQGKIPSYPMNRLVESQSWKIALMLVQNLLTGKILLFTLHLPSPRMARTKTARRTGNHILMHSTLQPFKDSPNLKKTLLTSNFPVLGKVKVYLIYSKYLPTIS
jgi:hypothetical protein